MLKALRRRSGKFQLNAARKVKFIFLISLSYFHVFINFQDRFIVVDVTQFENLPPDLMIRAVRPIREMNKDESILLDKIELELSIEIR